MSPGAGFTVASPKSVPEEKQAVIMHRSADVGAAIEEVFADLQQFAGATPRDDDVTIVIVKALA